MDEEEGCPGRLAVSGRTVIDMRPPFKSVKEAVMLFGECVLTGEVAAPWLKQIREEKVNNESRGVVVSWKASTSVAEELEETRGSLSEARDENNRLANRIKHLKQELDQATREIEWLRLEHLKEEVAPRADPEIDAEEIKLIENVTQPSAEGAGGLVVRFEGTQKSMNFASPPLLTRVIMDKAETVESLTRPSLTNGMKRRMRMTKKGVVSVVVRLFSKRKSRDDHNGDKADDNIIIRTQNY